MNPRAMMIATIKRFDEVQLDEEALVNVARLDLQTGLEAISWLLRRQFIYKHKGKYYVSHLGDEYFEQVGFSLKKRTLKSWKEEVLSGIAEMKSPANRKTITFPSMIDRAVLSTSTIEGPEGVRPDMMLMELEQVRKLRKALCRELDITMEEYEALLKEGRIRICKNDHPHVGVFDRRGKKGFQHLCRKCRKERRKLSRKEKE